MKHVFVINPEAGAKGSADELRRQLAELGGEYDWEIYDTKAPRDATEFVKKCCAEHPDEKYRFYACGGDGTIQEVASGVVGLPNASMSVYACGSGNDFVKIYGGAERFRNVHTLLEAKEENIDILKVGDRYSLNVTNFGFDTCVAKTMIAVKRKKIIGGERAYVTGVVKAIFTARRNKCTVTADGEVLNPKGKMLLCTLANGQYVGGAFRCAPRSDNKDGLIDVCLFKPISLFSFLRVLGVYTAGNHLDDPRWKEDIEYRRAKVVHVQAPEGFAYTLDGEIVEENDFTVEILPGAVTFAVPAMPEAAAETVAAEDSGS